MVTRVRACASTPVVSRISAGAGGPPSHSHHRSPKSITGSSDLASSNTNETSASRAGIVRRGASLARDGVPGEIIACPSAPSTAPSGGTRALAGRPAGVGGRQVLDVHFVRTTWPVAEMYDADGASSRGAAPPAWWRRSACPRFASRRQAPPRPGTAGYGSAPPRFGTWACSSASVVVDVRVGGGGSASPPLRTRSLALVVPRDRGADGRAGGQRRGGRGVLRGRGRDPGHDHEPPGDAGDAGDAAVSGSRELGSTVIFCEFSRESLEGRARAHYHGGEICKPRVRVAARFRPWLRHTRRRRVSAPPLDEPPRRRRRVRSPRRRRARSANASASVVVVAAEPSDAPAVRVVASTAVAFARVTNCHA